LTSFTVPLLFNDVPAAAVGATNLELSYKLAPYKPISGHKLQPILAGRSVLTGMRISELRGLTWDCVDFDLKLIRIQKRADRYNDMGKPKSRSSKRSIPMAPTVINTLKDWKTSCPKGVLSLVFPNGKGNVENHSNIHNRVFVPLLVNNGIVDAAGKPKFSFHALRHAAASLFIEQNWPPKKIQSLLGHSSINMTMDVYGHLFESPEDDVELFEKLERDLLVA